MESSIESRDAKVLLIFSKAKVAQSQGDMDTARLLLGHAVRLSFANLLEALSVMPLEVQKQFLKENPKIADTIRSVSRVD